MCMKNYSFLDKINRRVQNTRKDGYSVKGFPTKFQKEVVFSYDSSGKEFRFLNLGNFDLSDNSGLSIFNHDVPV